MDTQAPFSPNAPPTDFHSVLDRLLDEAESETETASRTATPSVVPAAAEASPLPDPPATVSEQTAPTGSVPSLLGGLLANPALLSALPTLAENLAPLLGGLSGGKGSAPTATRPHTIDRHTALLCAIKPYLSPNRQNAAETVIRLCRVWDALERSGISLSGLLSTVGGAIPVAQNTGRDEEVT